MAAGRFDDGAALQAALGQSAEILGDRVLAGHDVTEADLRAGWVVAGSTRFHGTALLIATGSVARYLPRRPQRWVRG